MLALIGSSFEAARSSHEDLEGLEFEPALAAVSVQDLPRLKREQTVPEYELDRLLAAVLRCYRRRPTGPWAALVLETLAPTLVPVADQLARCGHAADEGAIDGRVLLEALTAALSMRLPAPPVHLRRRIALLVATRTLGWINEVSAGG